MLHLDHKLAGMKVYVGNSKKYIYKPFFNHFPTDIHLLCDFFMEDDV